MTIYQTLIYGRLRRKTVDEVTPFTRALNRANVEQLNDALGRLEEASCKAGFCNARARLIRARLREAIDERPSALPAVNMGEEL